MLCKGVLIEHWWALVGVVGTRFFDIGIGGTGFVGAIGTVDAYPAFAFSDGPLERGED
jgi:hypothetical protein